jgi:hypothetical protein
MRIEARNWKRLYDPWIPPMHDCRRCSKVFQHLDKDGHVGEWMVLVAAQHLSSSAAGPNGQMRGLDPKATRLIVPPVVTCGKRLIAVGHPGPC